MWESKWKNLDDKYYSFLTSTLSLDLKYDIVTKMKDFCKRQQCLMTVKPYHMPLATSGSRIPDGEKI